MDYPILGMFIGLLFLFPVAVITGTSIAMRRTQKMLADKQVVVSQYSPPKNITPAELGYLFDRRFGNGELLATIIGLHSKGLVDITSETGSNFSMAINHAEDKNKHVLDDCEAAVLSDIRSAPGGVKQWRGMVAGLSEFIGPRNSFDHEVLNQLIAKGYIRAEARNYSRNSRIKKLALSLLLSTGFMTYIHLNYIASDLPFSAEAGFSELDRGIALLAYTIPILVLAFFFYLYISVLMNAWHQHSGAPRFATQQLYDIWDDIEGFREYLRVVEYPKLKEKPSLDADMLPYCVALGFKFAIDQAISKHT